eukprot:TRINITY_DN6479_c0_g2_i1.p2 TRINITY_DN6479_c0_g2~~TRINITY_DN6479_c0_g2_i1.p2  ORF type:complete len:164 (+),score=33.46 TRINITY_DN6479_c0_g2_i1:77-568(+)
MDVDEMNMESVDRRSWIGSSEKMMIVCVFFGLVALRAMWAGLRISEHAGRKWDTWRSPVQRTLTQEELAAKQKAARERMVAAHEAKKDEYAAKRQEDKEEEAKKNAKKLQKQENKIRGIDDSDDDDCCAPRGARPETRPWRAIADPNAGNSGPRFGGARRRGG